MNSLVKVVLVSVLISLLVAGGVVYFAGVGKDGRDGRDLGATPGNDFDSPYYSRNGVQYYQHGQPMIASTTALCSYDNALGLNATSSILNIGDSVTANRTGANQLISISTTTLTGAYATSSPALVLDWGLTTTGSGSGAGRSLFWAPSTATTTKTGGDTAVKGTLEAFNSVTGQSNAILGPTDKLTWRIATATPMTITAGANDIAGFCSALFQKL